jgi:hypothetical protein
MTSSRNLLASLIEQGELTHEEIVVEFNERSRTLREDATLSVRTLRRWLAGDTTWPRPAQRRVAQQYWGRTMVELLGPSVQDPLVAGFQREPAEPASSGIEAQLLMATTRAGQFARMMESGGIGGEGLAILKDDVAHIAAIGETLPAVNVLGGLVELQESIFSVIERGGHRVRDARDLFVAAAMTTAMLSRITQDLGRSHQALSLCRTVYVCADAAEHLALQAWARNEMSLISYRAGSARRATSTRSAACSTSPPYGRRTTRPELLPRCRTQGVRPNAKRSRLSGTSKALREVMPLKPERGRNLLWREPGPARSRAPARHWDLFWHCRRSGGSLEFWTASAAFRRLSAHRSSDRPGRRSSSRTRSRRTER